MLNLAENLWHLALIILTFSFGALLSIVQYRTFRLPQRRVMFYYLWHTGFSYLYYVMSFHNNADSAYYYLASLTPPDKLSIVGTGFIVQITSFLSTDMGFSYGGTFLVFNIFGFIGLLGFAAALHQIHVATKYKSSNLSLLLPLLPGLNFWSSALGKDAISFCAVGLISWGCLNFSKRYQIVITSVLIMALVRPHIAILLIFSLVLTMLFLSKIRFIRNILLVSLFICFFMLFVRLTLEYVGLGNSLLSIIDGDLLKYILARQDLNSGGNSSIDIGSMSVPTRLMTYVFRPLFWDAKGFQAISASVENLIILLMIGTAFIIRLSGRKSKLAPTTTYFILIFSLLSWILLANTTANLGIAVRQKWMFVPLLLLMASSYFDKRTKLSKSVMRG